MIVKTIETSIGFKDDDTGEVSKTSMAQELTTLMELFMQFYIQKSFEDGKDTEASEAEKLKISLERHFKTINKRGKESKLKHDRNKRAPNIPTDEDIAIVFKYVEDIRNSI